LFSSFTLAAYRAWTLHAYSQSLDAASMPDMRQGGDVSQYYV